MVLKKVDKLIKHWFWQLRKKRKLNQRHSKSLDRVAKPVQQPIGDSQGGNKYLEHKTNFVFAMFPVSFLDLLNILNSTQFDMFGFFT